MSKAGFTDVRFDTLKSVWAEQLKAMSPKQRVSPGIWYHHYFLISARKPEK